MKTRLLLILILFGLPQLTAQTLSLDSVIHRVLKNNFDVQSSKLGVEQAENNATKGNAGLLPSVQLNTGGSYSNNNTQLKFAGNIPDVNVDGAVNTSYNASVGATYTIFNGFANLRTYEKLMLAEDISQEQLQLTLENALITTIGLYLDLNTLQQNEVVSEQILRLSGDRVKRIRSANNLGVSTSLDLLGAESDYNNDSITLLSLRNQKAKIIRQINMLMGAAITDTWSAMPPTNLPKLELGQILKGARENSTLMVLTDLQNKSSILDQDLASANRMPMIAVSASYGYVSSQNAAGIVLEQNNLGLNSSLNISLPIYNGGKIKTAVANSIIRMEQSEINKKKTAQLVELEVYNYWEDLIYQQELVKLQNRTLDVVQARHDQAKKRYESGQITSLEYREAQLALARIKSEINSTNSNIQKSMYQLLRLEGRLVND